MPKITSKPKCYTYTVYELNGSYYVMLYNADNGKEAGFMQRNGKPTWKEGLKEEFDTREQAKKQASSWKHSL